MRLFQFAYCYDYEKKINNLSILCPEKWSFGSNSDNMILKNQRPQRADYFANPVDLVFDKNCEIIPQYSHIFNDPDNFLRIPENVRESMNKIMLFDGAIKRAKLMINANYKTAVPQYYKGKIQLLIPICLISENVPGLALAVSKNGAGDQYLGHTCLTLDMAYNNARLIARPDSLWLKPQT